MYFVKNISAFILTFVLFVANNSTVSNFTNDTLKSTKYGQINFNDSNDLSDGLLNFTEHYGSLNFTESDELLNFTEYDTTLNFTKYDGSLNFIKSYRSLNFNRLHFNESNLQFVAEYEQNYTDPAKTKSITTSTFFHPYSKRKTHKEYCLNSSDCETNLICHNNRCLCVYATMYVEYIQKQISRGRCLLFPYARCNNDIECQDMDSEMICNSFGHCSCRKHFYFERGLCIESKYHKKAARCKSNSDCPYPFAFCYQNIECRCWSSFEYKGYYCERKKCTSDEQCNYNPESKFICKNTGNIKTSICICPENFYIHPETRDCLEIQTDKNYIYKKLFNIFIIIILIILSLIIVTILFFYKKLYLLITRKK